MNRRQFLALASGLLVPEWLLDPAKGRAMVSVPGMPRLPHFWRFDVETDYWLAHNSSVLGWDRPLVGTRTRLAWRPEVQP